MPDRRFAPVLRRAVAALVAILAIAALAPATASAETLPGAIGASPTIDYVRTVHRLFLGRDPSAAEIDRWTPVVDDGHRDVLTSALATSDEWAGVRVDDLYRRILGRAADADGRSHWVGRIAGGHRLEDIAASFYGSDEYFVRHGSTHRRFVEQLYVDLLGRTPDGEGVDHWVGALDRDGLDRSDVAGHFHGSIESRRQRVDARYAEVLGRAPDRSGRDHWTDALVHVGDIRLAAFLAASAELHRLATGVPPARVVTAPVGAQTAYPLASSWREGCPVGARDLVAVEFDHFTMEGTITRGVLIVHRSAAAGVASVVRAMYGARFPLSSARPIDDFGGDDDASMAADNSSAFNCRRVEGTTSWSEHAYGVAVDLNPVRNPHVSDGAVNPPAGAGWLDRSDVRPGMVVEDGPVVRAFDRIRWGWGGRWQSAKDYQHFSASGR